MSRCRCHSDALYDTLTECPNCHHWSLDREGNWEGCERRSCGFQRIQADCDARELADRLGRPIAMLDVIQAQEKPWKPLVLGPNIIHDGWGKPPR